MKKIIVKKIKEAGKTINLKSNQEKFDEYVTNLSYLFPDDIRELKGLVGNLKVESYNNGYDDGYGTSKERYE